MNMFKTIALISALVLGVVMPVPMEPIARGATIDRSTKKKRFRLADRRKRNRKSRTKTVSEDKAETPKSSTLHGNQEAGDEPYRWDVSLLSDLFSQTRKIGEASTGESYYNLQLKSLYLLNAAFEVGPVFSYSETSQKTAEETLTTSQFSLDLIAKYNFGDLDQDTTIFYLFAGAGYSQTTIPAGEEELKSSGTRFQGGAGIHYFVDSNVALTAEGFVVSGSETADGAEEATEVTEIHFLRLGFSLFI